MFNELTEDELKNVSGGATFYEKMQKTQTYILEATDIIEEFDEVPPIAKQGLTDLMVVIYNDTVSLNTQILIERITNAIGQCENFGITSAISPLQSAITILSTIS